MSVTEGEHELGNMATAQAQPVAYDADKPGSPQVEEVKGKESYEDEQALARLGKKPVLKVRACTYMLESRLASLGIGRDVSVVFNRACFLLRNAARRLCKGILAN